MKLYTFEEITSFININEEKLLWKFLLSKDMKLKDVRFTFNSCAIGTAINIASAQGEILKDITDYDSW